MAKKFKMKTIHWIIVIAILGLILFIYFGGIGMLQALSIAAMPTNVPVTPPSQKPSACSVYNLGDEYDSYFGMTIMDATRNQCFSGGGIWTKTENEISCWYRDVDTTVDCNHPFFVSSKKLCDSLNANYYCDNVNDYYGCICEGSISEKACTETDPTQDVHIFGTCTDSGDVSHPDVCPSETAVTQYWCANDGTCMGASDLCPIGEVCLNGVCVEEEIQVSRIFTTSSKWNGDMGGLAGVDEKCSNAASNAGLSGTWKALISISSVNAKDRMPDVEYRRMDNTLIATSKADLFDSNIANKIHINEFGVAEGWTHVATGTNADGTVRTDGTCDDWTSLTHTYGERGITEYSDHNWIAAGGSNSCDSDKHRLYCFEDV